MPNPATLNSALGLDANIRAIVRCMTADANLFASILRAYQAEFGQTPVQTCYRLAYALAGLPDADNDERVGEIMGMIERQVGERLSVR